jgi:hypothetical protein
LPFSGQAPRRAVLALYCGKNSSGSSPIDEVSVR